MDSVPGPWPGRLRAGRRGTRYACILSDLLARHDVADLVVDTEGRQVGEAADTLLAASRG